jgi:hypothetical protein
MAEPYDAVAALVSTLRFVRNPILETRARNVLKITRGHDDEVIR